MQRKVQASFQRWEMDRQRQHEAAMERWRGEARAHEKEMFGMFVTVMGECNNALTNMLRWVALNTWMLKTWDLGCVISVLATCDIMQPCPSKT